MAARDGGLPVRLVLPAQQVQADVDPVTTSSGVLGVPEDPARVGWWTGSARPGAARGSTVIDGHIDSATAGIGALWHLDQVAAGDRVQVVTSTGRTVNYRVVGRRLYEKAAGLPADLFDTGGAHRLVLISCGGDFDEATKSYEANVAVFAAPVAG